MEKNLRFFILIKSVHAFLSPFIFKLTTASGSSGGGSACTHAPTARISTFLLPITSVDITGFAILRKELDGFFILAAINKQTRLLVTVRMTPVQNH